ncbi:MAG: AarF/UbiB family protein [Actinomycetota bacterium]|nr:AarF/UbiB family protein [Actinomycetota bacterium]
MEWITSLLVQLAVLVLGGFAVGRILGIRLSWGRWLVSLVVGVTAGGTIAFEFADRKIQDIDPWLVFGASLLATMVVAADPFGLLGPPGRLPHAVTGILRIPRLVRNARRGAGRGRRYAQVVAIAARHGLIDRSGAAGSGNALQPTADTDRPRGRRLGRPLKASLEEAGGAFVKLGQILSTRPDLLPTEVTIELSRLQDDVASEPRRDVDALLAEELGSAPEQVFAEFDPNPIAAASIAQVHKARLASGEPVAVKVQRPGVRPIVERDLDIARRLAVAIEARTEWGGDIGVVDLADGFAEALLEELDFTVEARNTTTCRSALQDGSIVRIPAVHESLSTSRVLVLEWMEGVPLRDAGPLVARHGLDRTELARGLLRAILHQIVAQGVFHADPHPGNVFVRADGTLALIDLGSVGRLDTLQQSALLRIVVAMSRRDPRQMRDALLDVAQARSGADEDQLERALGQFLVHRLGEGMTPDTKLFADLMALMLDFGLTFPPMVGGVFRALVTLDGTLTQLDPGFNIIDESTGVAGEWIGNAVVPETLREALADQAISLFPVLRRLPRRIDRIASAAEKGAFTIGVRLFADERDVKVVSRLVNRGLVAFIAASLGLISVQLLQGPGTAALDPLEGLGYLGLGASVLLFLRVLVATVGVDK